MMKYTEEMISDCETIIEYLEQIKGLYSFNAF